MTQRKTDDTASNDSPGILARLFSRETAPADPKASEMQPKKGIFARLFSLDTAPADPKTSETQPEKGLLSTLADGASNFLNRRETSSEEPELFSQPATYRAQSTPSPHRRSRHPKKGRKAAIIIEDEQPSETVRYLERRLWEIYTQKTSADTSSATTPELPARISSLLSLVKEWHDMEITRCGPMSKTRFLSLCFGFATYEILAQPPASESSRVNTAHGALKDSITVHFPLALLENKWDNVEIAEPERALLNYLQRLVYYTESIAPPVQQAAAPSYRVVKPRPAYEALRSALDLLLRNLVKFYPTVNGDSNVYAYWKPRITECLQAIEKLPASLHAPLKSAFTDINDYLDNGLVLRGKQQLFGAALSEEDINALIKAIHSKEPGEGALSETEHKAGHTAAEDLTRLVQAFAEAIPVKIRLDASEATHATHLETLRELRETHREQLEDLRKILTKLYGLRAQHPQGEFYDAVNRQYENLEAIDRFLGNASPVASSSTPGITALGDRQAVLDEREREFPDLLAMLKALTSQTPDHIKALSTIYDQEVTAIRSRVTSLESELGELLLDEELESLRAAAHREKPIPEDPNHLANLRGAVQDYCVKLQELFERDNWRTVHARLKTRLQNEADSLTRRAHGELHQPTQERRRTYSANPYSVVVSEAYLTLNTATSDVSRDIQRNDVTFKNWRTWCTGINGALQRGRASLEALVSNRQLQECWDRLQTVILSLRALQGDVSETTLRRYYCQENLCHTANLSALRNSLDQAVTSAEACMGRLPQKTQVPVNMYSLGHEISRHEGTETEKYNQVRRYLEYFQLHEDRLRSPCRQVAQTILERVRQQKTSLGLQDERRALLTAIETSILGINTLFLNMDRLGDICGTDYPDTNPTEAYRLRLIAAVEQHLQSSDMERFSDGANNPIFQFIRRYILYPLQCLGNLCSGNRFFITWGAGTLETEMANCGTRAIQSLNAEAPENQRPQHVELRDDDDDDGQNFEHGPSSTLT